MDSLLIRRGHHVCRPSLTGLGERVHLASPSIGLATHIEDVVNTILWENLHDIVLVGHSYGGMVITGVADRVPERIHRLVYLDRYVTEVAFKHNTWNYEDGERVVRAIRGADGRRLRYRQPVRP